MKVYTRLFKVFGVLLVAALLFAVLPAGQTKAQVYDVIEGESIQAAIDAAAAGATITVGPGTYSEALVINKDLSIVGSGAGATFVTAPTSPVITVTVNNVSLQGVTIGGGGLLVEGIHVNGATAGLSLEDVKFLLNNGAGNAYGVRFMNSFDGFSVNNSSFEGVGDPNVYEKAVGVYLASPSTAKNFSFTNSRFEKLWLGIHISGYVDGLQVEDNHFGPMHLSECVSGASAIYIGDGPDGVTVADVNVLRNTFEDTCRGFYMYEYRNNGVITNLTINENTFNNTLYDTAVKVWSKNTVVEGPVNISKNTFIQDKAFDYAPGVSMIDLSQTEESLTSQINIEENNLTFSNASFGASTFGFMLRGPFTNVLIKDNDLAGGNVGGVTPNMPPTSGIVLVSSTSWGGFSSDANVMIEKNVIGGFVHGVNIFDSPAGASGGLPVGAVVNLSKNQITGNTVDLQYGVGEIVDASPNWWGSTDGPGVGSVVGDVKANPWCYNAECTELYVEDGGSIQDAIDIASAGDTVRVGAGTYTAEDRALAIIDKPLTLIGESQTTTILDGGTYGAGTDSTGLGNSWTRAIVVQADNVTIENLLIRNYQGDQVTVGGFAIAARASESWGVTADNISNLIIQNVTFQDTYMGIRADSLDSALIQNNTYDVVSGVANYFVYIVTSNDLVVRANDSEGGCYWVTDASNALIGGPQPEDGNSVVDAVYNGIWLGQQFSADTSSSGTIQNNTVNGAEEGGIVVWNWPGDTAEIQIKDNIVSNVKAVSDPHGGISVYNGVFNNLVITGNDVTDSIEVAPKPAPPGLLIIANTINGADVSRNTFSTNSGEGIYLYDVTRNGDVAIELNKITDNSGAGLKMEAGSATLLDGSPNWWGSIYGPAAGQIIGNVDYDPWCGDAQCSFTVSGDDTGTGDFYFNEAGQLVLRGNINIPGGFMITEDGLTVLLEEGTTIQNDSPCFTVTGDNITILGEYPGEEYCIATGTSAGVEVADGVKGLTVKNLDFDGSNTTGSALNFAGVIDGVQILNNKMHDFGTRPAIDFGGEVLTEHTIQGNLFLGFGTNAITTATTAIDASWNSWGAATAPTVSDVTTTPVTHADLWMESTGAYSGDQVAKGESITYTIYADMVNITGAEFVLNYPTNLLTLDTTTNGDGLFIATGATLLDTSVPGVIGFSGIVPFADPPVTNTQAALFTVTFTADATLTGTNILGFTEVVSGFSMIPDVDHYTNHVYPTEFVDGEVTLIDLPIISSMDIQGYYLTGEQQEFSVTLTNPSAGGNFSNVLFHFVISSATAADIDSLQYYEANVAPLGWYDLPFAEVGGDLVGTFGPAGGYPLAAGDVRTSLFRVNFVTDRDYDVQFQLVDVISDPADAELAVFNATGVAYDPAVITSSDINGPYIAGVEEDFSVNVVIDGDMLPTSSSGIVFELFFDFPDGTIVKYGATTTTCGATGCLIPVTLTGVSTDLDFSVTFPDAFSGGVVVTLFDTAWDPDRPLGTEAFSPVVYANLSIDGKVSMQGRYQRGGVPVTLTHAIFTYPGTSLDQLGKNLFFANVAADVEYTVTTNQPRYLNVDASLAKRITFTTTFTTLPDLYLYGGNAIWTDNVIDILDAGLVGTDYGKPGDIDADVNFDGVVNIQDLALVGGNYLKTSADVYATWLP